jgi:hypothetical protein
MSDAFETLGYVRVPGGGWVKVEIPEGHLRSSGS